jgi:antirestriction protein ArdC
MAREATPTAEAIAKAMESVITADDYLAFLDFQRSFRTRSLANRCLIWAQRPDATLCKGFRQWKNDHGRWVRKGEKGIAINVPITYTKAQVEAQPELAGAIKGFTCGYVFDVSQTDGPPLPSPPQNAPDNRIDATDTYAMLATMIQTMTGLPIHHDINLGAYGLHHRLTGQITIRADLAHTAEGVYVAAHELAHHIDQQAHPDKAPSGIDMMLAVVGSKRPGNYATNEIVAETSSWMFARDRGIDARSQLEYVRDYAMGDMDAVKAALPRAFHCHTVLTTEYENLATVIG